jgi:hypothetical protein
MVEELVPNPQATTVTLEREHENGTQHQVKVTPTFQRRAHHTNSIVRSFVRCFEVTEMGVLRVKCEEAHRACMNRMFHFALCLKVEEYL